MKKILIAGMCLTASLGGFAQGGKVISAFNLYSEYLQNPADKKSLEEANTSITEASANDNTKEENKTWYYKGYISQLIFGDSVLQPKYPTILLEASKSYQNVITLSEKPDGKKKFVEESYNNLGTVAGQLHNYGISFFEKGKDNNAAFNTFKEVLNIYDFMTKRGQQSKIKVKIENTKFLAAVTADRLKKTDDAKQLYEQLVAIKYPNIYIYKALANIYGESKEEQKALAALDEGIKVYPDSSTLLIDKLNIYLVGGRQTEALDIMNRAIQLDPKNAQLYFVLANTYGKMKDEEKTVANYKKAIEIDPKYADAYNNLGAIYLDKANALIEKMSASGVSDAQYQKMDAERLGYLKQALPYLEKAAEFKPKSLEILDVLKTIYAKLNDYDKVAEVKKKMSDLQAEKKSK